MLENMFSLNTVWQQTKNFLWHGIRSTQETKLLFVVKYTNIYYIIYSRPRDLYIYIYGLPFRNKINLNMNYLLNLSLSSIYLNYFNSLQYRRFILNYICTFYLFMLKSNRDYMRICFIVRIFYNINITKIYLITNFS